MKEKLVALYRLQVLDSTLDELKRQFSVLDAGSAEKQAFQAAETAAAEAQSDLNRTAANLKDAELEQQQVETKRKQYEDKLYSGKVTNPKELQAMQAEVEMLGRQKSTLDERIIVLMGEVETKKQINEQSAIALKAARKAYTARYAAYKESAEAVKAKAQGVIADRAKALEGVDPTLIKQYEKMRAARGGLALAAIQDGNACGGCKMALPSTLVTRIKEGKSIEVCQNCGRMLCIAPPAEKG
jgi:uncharacterized protein